jgi:hypothetical protein
MKTQIQKTQLFSSSIISIRIFIFFLSLIGFSSISNAQVIPAICLESPSADFVDAFNFLKANVQAQRTIVATVWEFNTTSMTFDAIGIGNNQANLIKTGTISYKKADVEGNSCLKQKTISMKKTSSCSSSNISIKWTCGVGGQGGLPANPGFINYNGFGYTKVGVSGASFNRSYLFKKDTAPFNYLMITFQGIAVL